MSVEVSYTGPRADLTLNRPDVLNAMNWQVFDGLARCVDEIGARSDIRVVVISGRGRSFSSGIDTQSFGELAGSDGSGPEDMIARAQAGFRKLLELPVPTIAKVRGHALGAGLQLALACDVRVVAADASLGLLEGRYGIVPDLGGTQRLPALIGPGRAKKMIWLAERIDGAEAGRIGLAEIVTATEDLDAAVDELADRIASAPPLAAREAKRLVDLAARVGNQEGMDEEARSQVMMLSSQDFGEAISAFLEGRSPSYSGK